MDMAMEPALRLLLQFFLQLLLLLLLLLRLLLPLSLSLLCNIFLRKIPFSLFFFFWGGGIARAGILFLLSEKQYLYVFLSLRISLSAYFSLLSETAIFYFPGNYKITFENRVSPSLLVLALECILTISIYSNVNVHPAFTYTSH